MQQAEEEEEEEEEVEEALTHCSVLAFDAPEGQVLLPSKVARCLWGASSSACGQTVSVRFKVLPKAIGATLQPVKSFAEEVAPNVRDLLEAELERHCTLTVGDCFTVAGGIEVRVRELLPADAVSLVGTEIAVSLLPSVENEEGVREAEARRVAAQDHARQRAEALAAVAAQVQASRGAGTAGAAGGEPEEVGGGEREEGADKESDPQALAAALDAAKARLPPEPAEDSGGALCTLQLSLSGSGEKAVRRFLLQAPGGNAFLHDFATVVSSGRARGTNFQIVSRMPRRVLPRDGALTLQESGLEAGSSALVVELTVGEDAGSLS